MAFPFHPCEEMLHISITKIWIVKSTYFQQVWNFILVRTLYWSVMIYLFAVFLYIHDYHACLKMGDFIIL